MDETLRNPNRVSGNLRIFRRWPALVSFVCSVLGIGAGAQESPVPQVGSGSSGDMEDEVVHLSPFETDASDDVGNPPSAKECLAPFPFVIVRDIH
jgi:hypothetical protein